MTTDTYKLRRRVKILYGVITLLAIAICCLMVRLDSALEPKIIGVRGADGMNTVDVQHVDTTEYFNVPDSMLDRLYHNVSLITRADTSRD